MRPELGLPLRRYWWSCAGRPNRFSLCGYDTGKRTHRRYRLVRISPGQDQNQNERWCRWSLESPFESAVWCALLRVACFLDHSPESRVKGANGLSGEVCMRWVMLLYRIDLQ